MMNQMSLRHGNDLPVTRLLLLVYPAWLRHLEGRFKITVQCRFILVVLMKLLLFPHSSSIKDSNISLLHSSSSSPRRSRLSQLVTLSRPYCNNSSSSSSSSRNSNLQRAARILTFLLYLQPVRQVKTGWLGLILVDNSKRRQPPRLTMLFLRE